MTRDEIVDDDYALSDLLVVELSSGIAGGYCARLLCDAGAQVVNHLTNQGYGAAIRTGLDAA